MRGVLMVKGFEDYKLINDIFLLSRRIRLLRKQNMATDMLTEAELLILDYLAQNRVEPPTMSQVADAVGLTYSHLSKVISCLETKNGWVERAIDPKDRRHTLLSISKVGHKMLEKAQEEERERMRLIIPRLSETEKGIIAEGISIFNRTLDEIKTKEETR